MAEVFLYTGVGEGAVAPKGVVRVRVDPSVLAIPASAFADRFDLKLVELMMESIALENVHSRFATSLNSDVRHSLPHSLMEYSTFVKKCFPSSYLKISLKWNSLLSNCVVHCEMLPLRGTQRATRRQVMLFNFAGTFYKFLAQKR